MELISEFRPPTATRLHAVESGDWSLDGLLDLRFGAWASLFIRTLKLRQRGWAADGVWENECAARPSSVSNDEV